MELIPARAAFLEGEPIGIDVVGADGPVKLEIRRLAEMVAVVEVEPGTKVAELPSLPAGGYGADSADGTSSTAFDVLAHPLQRLRYGFACDFSPGREVDGLALPESNQGTDALLRVLPVDTASRVPERRDLLTPFPEL